MKSLVGLCLSLVFWVSWVEAHEFPLGEVVERVVCKNNPDQSYALYLPSGYDPARTWPALYAFDPVARGALPVELLAPAAERFGYIVVGSNNSRNGRLPNSYDAARAMFEDTFRRFSVDSDRIYMTGFSGGARVISQLAVMAQNISGIIACGAGLYPNVPPGRFRFSYVGISGNGDMNYREMNDLHETLTTQFKTPNRLFIFSGGHEWPPLETLERALVWLELEPARAGKKRADPTFLSQAFSQELSRVEKIEEQGELFESYQAYMNLERDFSGLMDVSAVHDRVVRLSSQPAVKSGLREAAEVRKTERREIEKYSQYMQLVFGDRPKSLSWWRKHVDQLVKRRDEAKNEMNRLLWIRMYDILWRSAIESAWMREDAAIAVRYARIAAVVYPSSPYIQFSLGRAEARAGNLSAALAALDKAIDLGMTRVAPLEDDASFDPLRDLDSFKELVSRLESAARP